MPMNEYVASTEKALAEALADLAEVHDAANRMRARLNTAVDELAGARAILGTIPGRDRTAAMEAAYERLYRTWRRRSAAFWRLVDARDNVRKEMAQ